MKPISLFDSLLEKIRRRIPTDFPIRISVFFFATTPAIASASQFNGVSQFALLSTGVSFFLMALLFLGVVISAGITDSLAPALSLKTPRMSRWLKENGQEILFYVLIFAVMLAFCSESFGQVRIPGSDESAKLKAAGTLLMLMDTALFVWLARIFAGLCVLSAGWLIKEQKFGPAVVCVLGALVIGTSPMWVQNIFEIGGGGGVFK